MHPASEITFCKIYRRKIYFFFYYLCLLASLVIKNISKKSEHIPSPFSSICSKNCTLFINQCPPHSNDCVVSCGFTVGHTFSDSRLTCLKATVETTFKRRGWVVFEKVINQHHNYGNPNNLTPGYLPLSPSSSFGTSHPKYYVVSVCGSPEFH